ncbi:hypothetical protein MCOR03_006280 [Pyricularia oryzae]|uniref:Dihydroorotate dehydrogenase (quinone), mitochondrial n=1 Tax=Pyricularia grisea TaxID=148305 RepID=A0ABQ8NRS9_PYRGI|nr:hypothetical protein MCOR33_003421 [Pyricularia grisea]KAI6388677.1 hypothetical protein MCOR32_000085 [Pyricularia oryzae]KAI6471705.1 hypothetical protein MCOR15_000839 [Pyricularia oryzae]KAI6534726.1 hypothetical protein MCOR16_003049 [Pyricularia oryzae]KAI6556552.1 hypothetical protein MCOR03_006280 [Pyricularia oryzae]
MASHSRILRLSGSTPSFHNAGRLRFQPPRRHASTVPPSSETPVQSSVLSPGARVFIYSAATAVTAYATYLYATDTRANLLHRYIVPPLLRTLVPDAEDAHHFGTAAMKAMFNMRLHIRDRTVASDEPILGVTVFGRRLANPVGISAGLDKDAQIPDALFAVGPAVVEVGGITPHPQKGNPQPRVFRVPTLEGMVNRYGLNSAGADAVARTLRARLRSFARENGLTEADVLEGRAGVPVGSLAPGRLLCVQVAKAKETDEADIQAVARDYTRCVERLAPYADVLVVNVSSPNTPGLRDLQRSGPLASILSAVVGEAKAAAARCGRAADPPRVMVKVSPDEDSDAQVEGVVEAVWGSGVDGVIVGNTTKRRDVIPPRIVLSGKEVENLHETGGFSGPALFDRTVSLVAKYRKALDGHSFSTGAGRPAAAAVEAGANMEEVSAQAGAAAVVVPPPTKKERDEQKVIFATGGITNGEQALAVLNAGASVAMVYTGMVYGGAGTVTRIKGEMKKQLTQS